MSASPTILCFVHFILHDTVYFSPWSFLLLSVLQSLFLLTPVSPAVFYTTVSTAISGPLSFPVSPVVPGTLYFSSPAALLCTFLSSVQSVLQFLVLHTPADSAVSCPTPASPVSPAVPCPPYSSQSCSSLFTLSSQS
jgi:hypothetical protein